MEIPLIHKNKVRYYELNDLSIRQINNILYLSEYYLNKLRKRFYNKHPIPIKALIKLTQAINSYSTILTSLESYVKNQDYRINLL